MSKNEALRQVRRLLVRLYTNQGSIQRVVDDADLDSSQLDLQGLLNDVWHRVLLEADRQKRVDAIIQVVCDDYPGSSDELVQALKAYVTADQKPELAHSEPKTRVAEQVTPGTNNGDGNTLEKVLVTQSTLLPISFLETGLQCAKAVVRVIRGDGEKGSGFLTENNLLITNHHVLPNSTEAAQATIQFNYQQSVRGLDLEAVSFQLSPDEVFKTSDADDWTIVRVQGNPNQDWGALKLTRVNPKKDDWVNIIQHPGGGYKHIALYHNMITYADNRLLQYLTDTQPGSSGSPVFDSQWRVVALHHSAGWLREPNTKQMIFRNEGIHINVVIDALSAAGLYNEQ